MWYKKSKIKGKKNHILAALLSGIIPGLGQVYAGDNFEDLQYLLHWGLASA